MLISAGVLTRRKRPAMSNFDEILEQVFQQIIADNAMTPEQLGKAAGSIANNVMDQIADDMRKKPETSRAVNAAQSAARDCRLRTTQAHLNRFGEDIRHEYGWASGVIGKKAPTFLDIEEFTGLDHWRPRFKRASQHTPRRPPPVRHDAWNCGIERVVPANRAKQFRPGGPSPQDRTFVDEYHGAIAAVAIAIA